MNINTAFWFFKRLIDDNLCLLYSGHFSEEILRKVMDLSEIKIDSFDEFRKKKKRMLFLMAEGFQNIIKHGDKPELKKDGGINQNFFLTLSRGNAIFISNGNLIENDNVADLQKQLIEVNSLDEQGLKELHSYVMKHGSLSHKGGAGLGLITIARKSDQKLNYSFENFNDNLSFYYNQIILKSSDDLSEEEVNALLPISESIGFHKKMISENILIIQKGDFSQDSIVPVLNIVENNLQEKLSECCEMKDFYDILHQMLENIHKHGLEVNDKKEGVFILAKTDSNYVVNTGNFIAKDKIEALENPVPNPRKGLSEIGVKSSCHSLSLSGSNNVSTGLVYRDSMHASLYNSYISRITIS